MWDWLYPRRCAVCDGLLRAQESLCCTPCRKKLTYIAQPYCCQCGKPLESETREYCGDCSRKKKSFCANRALLLYDETVQASLLRLKSGGRREYAAFYGEQIAQCLGTAIRSWDADAILPVPLHRTRLRRRGYNQAEWIARTVGERLELPVVTDYLVRDVQTKALKQLNPVERLKNLEKAFHLRENDVKLEKVILLDDIYTTGATMEACSRVLRAGGVRAVYGVTVAAGQGD